jgi:hypothetical protein
MDPQVTNAKLLIKKTHHLYGPCAVFPTAVPSIATPAIATVVKLLPSTLTDMGGGRIFEFEWRHLALKRGVFRAEVLRTLGIFARNRCE